MRSKAKYYDSPDLRENFKKKPVQLENVLRNADKIVCPITKATLYGVPDYTKENEAELIKLRERKRSIETAGVSKRAKKVAAKKKAKPQEGGATEDVDPTQAYAEGGAKEKQGLSPTQNKFMQNELEHCQGVAVWCGELSKHCEKIKDYTSKATLDELASTSAQIEQTITELEMYLSQEFDASTLEFDDVKASVSQTKGVIEKSKRALTKSITGASKQAGVGMITPTKPAKKVVKAEPNAEVDGLEIGRGIAAK